MHIILIMLLLLSLAQERSHFLSATVGENITLRCFHKDFTELGVRLFWYKQSLGVKPTLVSTNSKYHKINSLHGEFNSSKRFTLGRETNDLQIKRVQVSDSAVYLCLAGVLHNIDILESYTVIVKSLNVQAKVYQPPYEDAEEGRTMILNCSVHTGSCGEQPRVHWFKQSEESTPGVLYSDGDRCENSTDRPTNSCVYSLPIRNMSSEQTGTYYCAVAACGQVLFGNGTAVMIKGKLPIKENNHAFDRCLETETKVLYQKCDLHPQCPSLGRGDVVEQCKTSKQSNRSIDIYVNNRSQVLINRQHINDRIVSQQI
uniref:Ig-like domain-containing protein n=1 Tax=Neogobius melanostomus TaxID=47308 RepID=A0A8C6SVB3_9GOBI